MNTREVRSKSCRKLKVTKLVFLFGLCIVKTILPFKEMLLIIGVRLSLHS